MDTNRTHPTTNKAPVIPGFCENSASAVIQIAVIVPTQEIAKRCAGNAMMYMVLLPSTRTRVAGVMEIRTPTNPAMTVHAKEQYVVEPEELAGGSERVVFGLSHRERHRGSHEEGSNDANSCEHGDQ